MSSSLFENVSIIATPKKALKIFAYKIIKFYINLYL